MLGLSGPQGLGAWRFLWLCGAVALVLAVLFALLSSGLDPRSRLLISDVSLVVCAVLAFLSCAFRSREWTGRRGRAWRFFALAVGFGALGNLWVLVLDLSGAGQTASWFTNACFMLGLVLGMIGLSSFPSVPRRGTDFARMLVDGVIIGGSIVTIASVIIFPELVSNARNTSASLAETLLPPILEVAVLTLAVLLIVRIGRIDRTALIFVSSGLALYVVSALTQAVQISARGSFEHGTVIDLGWIAGYLLIGLAGQHPASHHRVQLNDDRDASPAVGTMVVFSLLLLAALFSMISTAGDQLGNAAKALWLTLVCAVAARQILLIIDNDRLRQGLERRVLERTTELRHATVRSELLLSSVGEGIYGVDHQGLVTFINPAGAAALGYRAQDLIGTEAHATFHAVQKSGTPYPLESCYVTEAILDGTVTNAEEDVYVAANGRSFSVEVTATPMARDDFVLGAVVVFRDVTQRQEVDRLKSEFVSMVSHELRTPLTSIRGSLGLLSGGALGAIPAPAIRMVNLALDSSARLTRLINDILDVERIESGTMPMQVDDHRADELVEAAVSQLRLMAAQVEVQLVVLAAEGVVHADPDRVVQTLINLIDNAIKFSPRKSVVEVSAHETATFVEFCIRDHGRGVPAAKIDRIFNRFEQVDSSDARDKGGSGLGLAISRSVIERLNGRIWAESEEGSGAVFRFILPRADAAGAVASQPALLESQPDPDEGPPVFGADPVRADTVEAGR